MSFGLLARCLLCMWGHRPCREKLPAGPGTQLSRSWPTYRVAGARAPVPAWEESLGGHSDLTAPREGSPSGGLCASPSSAEQEEARQAAPRDPHGALSSAGTEGTREARGMGNGGQNFAVGLGCSRRSPPPGLLGMPMRERTDGASEPTQLHPAQSNSLGQGQPKY